jgi:hypothetical protein
MNRKKRKTDKNFSQTISPQSHPSASFAIHIKPRRQYPINPIRQLLNGKFHLNTCQYVRIRKNESENTKPQLSCHDLSAILTAIKTQISKD